MISDEVFVDYRYTDRPGDVAVAAAKDGALVFSLGGPFEVGGAPAAQARVDPRERRRADFSGTRSRRLEWVADAYLSVGTPVQLALPRLLSGSRRAVEAIWARVLLNERALRSGLPKAERSRSCPSAAGWAACLRVPAVRPEEEIVLDLLESHDVLVHPGYFYEFPSEAWLVLSLLPPPDDFPEGVARLARALR